MKEPSKINVLIACEESQRVCVAFRERGFNAFSCDIQQCSGEHPEWHIWGNCLPFLKGLCEFYTENGEYHAIENWDLIIAHPPCTYLSNAGAARLYKIIDGETYVKRDRLEKGMDAKEFFLKFLNAECDRICVENPIPSGVYRLPKYTQTIQPYEFGHPFTKKTYLWLKGLPQLRHTDIVEPVGPYVCGNSEIWKKQAAKGTVYGKEKSAKHRSKTFHGVAKAMAEQWAGECK